LRTVEPFSKGSVNINRFSLEVHCENEHPDGTVRHRGVARPEAAGILEPHLVPRVERYVAEEVVRLLGDTDDEQLAGVTLDAPVGPLTEVQDDVRMRNGLIN